MAQTAIYNFEKPGADRDVDEEFYQLQETLDLLDAILAALQTAVNTKSAVGHTHAISDVINLASELAAKMPASTTFKLDDLTDVSGADGAPDNYVLVKSALGWIPSSALAALGTHGHLISEITGLVDALAGTADAAATTAALAKRVRVDASQSFSESEKGQALANLGIEYGALKWLSKAVGELYAVDTSLPGVDIPPIDDSRFRYVELTAGKTGAGSYNNGAMDTEVVTGSAPLVNATAVVRLAGSPLVSTGVRLINTERRFLRAGSAGTLQDDAMEQHFHSRNTDGANEVTARVGTGYADPGAGTTRQLVVTPQTGLVTSAHRTSTETRPRNIGATYFMRIK